ncbi:MAG: HAD family phosphatase [bacterium]|nr:HAD family phosphatase [bacterium]
MNLAHKKSPKFQAVIFDMDGVVVDNTDYHIKAWQAFSERHGYKVTAKQVREEFMGRLNMEVYKKIFGTDTPEKKMRRMMEQRELLYRKLYSKAIRPLPGLPEFLRLLKSHRIPVALATAAPTVNVRWVLRKTKLGKFFKKVVDGAGRVRGKPHPDIFLKAAKLINVRPADCVVLEDTILGLLAARRAGMRAVGVATTYSKNALVPADIVIKNFVGLRLKELERLF